MPKQTRPINKRPSADTRYHADDWFFHRVLPLTVLLTLVGLYPLLNLPWQPLHSTLSVSDTRIPLLPIFVIPYLFFFFPWLIGLVFWALFRNVRVFQKLSVALAAGMLLAYGLYMLYQTVVFRPLPENGGMLSDLLRWVYRVDARYNGFPSSHTYATVILVVTTLPLLRRWWSKTLTAIVAALIVLSTLFTKQHHIADVLGGIVVGALSLGLAELAFPIFFETTQPVTTVRAARRRPTRRVRSR